MKNAKGGKNKTAIDVSQWESDQGRKRERTKKEGRKKRNKKNRKEEGMSR